MKPDPTTLGPLDIRPGDFEWAKFGRVTKGYPWQGRAVVITGGTGFIGARLARKLALYGASVTIPTRDRRLPGTVVDPKIRLLRWDPADRASVATAVTRADTLFNLAYDFRRSGDANLALYRTIADAAAEGGLKRFVHASSIAVYDGWPTEDLNEASPCDGPGHAYKMAKRAMERDLEARVRKGEFDAAIIQPVNVYGPFSAMWTDAIAERIRAAGVVLPRDFDGLNNGVYVDDLVDAFIAAGDLPNGGGQRFIVAGPDPIPWTEMLAAYADGCGRAVKYEELRPTPDGPAPSSSAVSLKRHINGLVTKTSAHLATWIGTSRVRALRAQLAALLPPRNGPYRPMREDPRFFSSHAVVDASRAAKKLCSPAIDAAEGLARTRAYIAWRFGAQE